MCKKIETKNKMLVFLFVELFVMVNLEFHKLKVLGGTL